MTTGPGQEDTSRDSDSREPLAPMWVAAGFLAVSLFVYPFFAGTRAEDPPGRSAFKRPFTFMDLVAFRDLNRTDVPFTEVLWAAFTPYRYMSADWTEPWNPPAEPPPYKANGLPRL